jgi:SAM-dependent methyltransferase
MAALPPDYDADPGRWRSWTSRRDVHDVVAGEADGPVLDVGCGDGRLASLLAGRGIAWVGLDLSPTQRAANPHRPVVLADMRRLPFRAGAFATVAHLWCLYHVDDPAAAIAGTPRWSSWPLGRRPGPIAATTTSRLTGPTGPRCPSA